MWEKPSVWEYLWVSELGNGYRHEKSTFTYFYLGECGWQAAVPWVIKRKDERCDEPAVLSVGKIISPKWVKMMLEGKNKKTTTRYSSGLWASKGPWYIKSCHFISVLLACHRENGGGVMIMRKRDLIQQRKRMHTIGEHSLCEISRSCGRKSAVPQCFKNYPSIL